MGGNAVLVELRVFGVCSEHLTGVHSHLLQLFLFFSPLFLLFSSFGLFLLLPLFEQYLLGLELPNRWLAHLLILQPDPQIHHGVIPKIIANLQNLLEFPLGILPDLVPELCNGIEQPFLDCV